MTQTPDHIQRFIEDIKPFLSFLKQWEQTWPTVRLQDVVSEAGGAANVAVVCVDLLNCFARKGPLASKRVEAIISPVVELFKAAHELGVRNFVLPQEDHTEESLEFRAYGPHCLRGSEEAQTVRELLELPFADEFTITPKDSINPGIGTPFVSWADEHPNIRRYIVTGDCTDLCVYNTATWLRFRANQFHLDYEAVIPANCVDTYDMPVETAERLGVLPHDADLLHLLFLYHMALNDIRVVRAITS